MAHAYFSSSTPLILGHRGAAGAAPENTLLAFERGLELGAHILESDVQATREGVPVLVHDERVDRTTEGRGEIAQLALTEVQSLDAGYRFESPERAGRFPQRGRGLSIPTLEEAFRALPEPRFNLEIKSADTRAVGRVVEMVDRFEREDRTLLTAGDDPIMRSLRREIARSGTRPAIGASTGDVLEVVRSALDNAPPPADVMALQIPREFAGQPLVTPQLLDHCHGHGIQIHVWTIDEVAEMAELLDLGVDGLVTDHPERLAALLATRRG